MISKIRNILLWTAAISAICLGCMCKLLADSSACGGKEIAGMKCIPAGEFIRGSNTHEADEKPEEKVYVSDFYMDTYEVTNEEFDKCKNAGKCQECLKTGKCNYIGPRYGKPYLGRQQPAAGISWYTAKEFCEWAGKRLPTEAEWEKAARGTNGNLYPWGNEPATCERAIIEVGDVKGCVSKKTEKPHLMPTANVGTRAPGVYGLYDMAGNSWEWTADWYSPSFKACGEACRGKDPKGPCEGKDVCPGHTKKVLKSGSWWWPASYARGSKRRAHIPENFPEYHHFGFRCAKDANK
ncbi:formylglycine-generating enzyme family protein [Leptospira kmetyi]|uniref:formylglycine-generating enzyme family protein n=1 Tax=Leptospira kmetyi TaxID=408139 RepID=UPI001084327A|nr:SUMF1/EgtB/PvdO family nonheme iron enzyme [Leptospira kmetyi]TGL70938.1 formylglycine-generating enzyme family protein [Leptospira kmetyi]